jgi:hypothetical protein
MNIVGVDIAESLDIGSFSVQATNANRLRNITNTAKNLFNMIFLSSFHVPASIIPLNACG